MDRICRATGPSPQHRDRTWNNSFSERGREINLYWYRSSVRIIKFPPSGWWSQSHPLFQLDSRWLGAIYWVSFCIVFATLFHVNYPVVGYVFQNTSGSCFSPESSAAAPDEWVVRNGRSAIWSVQNNYCYCCWLLLIVLHTFHGLINPNDRLFLHTTHSWIFQDDH